MNDNDSVLLEHVWHELQAIREGQDVMAHVPRQLNEIDARLKNVESDVKVIKAVVTDHSSQFNNHETRITTLEQAV